MWFNLFFNMTTSMRLSPRALVASSTAFRDHPYVIIEADAVVNEEVVLRTHTFEDWQLKFGYVELKTGCTVGNSSTLMTGVVVGRGSEVLPNSLVMKNEHLEPGKQYGGLPAVPTGRTVNYYSLKPSVPPKSPKSKKSQVSTRSPESRSRSIRTVMPRGAPSFGKAVPLRQHIPAIRPSIFRPCERSPPYSHLATHIK